VAAIAVFAAMVLAYTLVSKKLGDLNISAPMVFTAVGTVIGLAVQHFEGEAKSVELVAEATLAMILFHDAAHAHPKELWADRAILGRMLLISLPIAIAAGWAVAYYLLPGAGVWLALLVAAALAATDAGLGAATILNPIVPVRVRRLLNGESGLNDGLATPVVLFAISAATVDTVHGDNIGHVVGEALLEIVIGLVVGVLIGYALGRLLHVAEVKRWAQIKLAPVGVAVMPLLAFFGAELVHGNGFIAAFIAGTAYAAVAGRELEHDLETTEEFVTILGYATWTLFGAIFVSRLSEFVGWRSVVYAVLSLTVLRMIPILFSLLGSGLARKTKWFLAWFGPRGLATVVFSLIAYESIPPGQFESDVAGVLSLTVLFSVIAHGITAPIFARKYGAWAEENQPAMEMAG